MSSISGRTPRLHVASLLAVILACALSQSRIACSAPDASSRLVGQWLGSLPLGAISLRVVLHVTSDGAGGLKATLDSPDQGASGIPVARVGVEGTRVTFDVPAVGATCRATLAADGNSLDGTWNQRGHEFPLKLSRVAHVPSAVRPQEPHPPFPYRVEEVTYPSAGDRAIQLSATLTVPRGPGPFPAVLLIAGSGPMTRDEVVLGHKPFLLLADMLTRRGIAVLRADKRGIGRSGGDATTATTQDYAWDAAKGVDFLLARKEIDHGHVGLLGHSEGAMVAPIVATRLRPGKVAFLVLLAGPAVTGREILKEQTRLLLLAEGVPEAEVKKTLALNLALYDLAVQPGDPKSIATRMRITLDAHVASLPEAARKHLGASWESGQIQVLLSPWFRAFLTFDPVPVLKAVHCPVLALFGSKDLQVPPEQNAAPMRAAFAAGGNREATVEVLPGLNHLFQHAGTGLPSEYGQIEETMAPDVLKRIGDWVVRVTGAKASGAVRRSLSVWDFPRSPPRRRVESPFWPDAESRRGVMALLFEMAMADGHVAQAELRVLNTLGRHLGIPSNEIAAMKAEIEAGV